MRKRNAGSRMVAAVFTESSLSLVQLEQTVLRELVRLAERNAAQPLSLAELQSAAPLLRRKLRQHSEAVEELSELARAHEIPADQAEAGARVARHQAEGGRLADSLRELGTRVQAQRPQQEAAARAELLMGGRGGGDGALDQGGTGRPEGLGDRVAVASARDTTETLSRTQKLMAEELQRSDATLRSLNTQSRSMQDTLQEHRAIVGSLNASRRALARLKRRDFTDRILLAAGLFFYCLVVLYIVKRRLGFAGWRLFSLFGAPPAPDLHADTAHAADDACQVPEGLDRVGACISE